MAHVVWIGYTTQYREGGRQFERVAQTLANIARRKFPTAEVRCVAVETKRAFKQQMAQLPAQSLRELHFVGHSGMYGIMFGTVALPEQFSPHEWRELALPFAPDGEAFFHCCRSARWFAPFFARTFGVPASGYHWYTTVSARPDRYVASPAHSTRPAFIIGMIGKKSHGYFGSAAKRSGLAKAERMKRFVPEAVVGDASYDGVAELYDAAYADIAVRGPEVAWLKSRIFAEPAPAATSGLRLLDIGCGNGALLAHLAPHLARGYGVDASAGMLAMAQRRNAEVAHLSFHQIHGPELPLPDASVDVVTSLLSFRYLDWDPLMNEIKRVLVPGGRLLIVDMVAAPVGLRDVPAYVKSKRAQLTHWFANRGFKQKLATLVRDPRWQTMLKYNPIRAQHEYVWYLESRFPGQKVETLDVGYHARVVAFDSGPLAPGHIAPQTYP